MVKIRLKKVIKNHQKTWTIALPTSWEDITSSQMWEIAIPLFTEQPHKAKFELLKMLVPGHIFNHIDEFQMSELGNCLEFLVQSPTLTKNLFPSWKGFLGPSELLAKTTVNEYARADTHLRNFLRKNKAEDLDYLVACLYRPAKKNYKKLKKSQEYKGDFRQDYNPDALPTLVKRVSKFPLQLKFATLIFFLGCKNKFVTLFKDIFPKTVEKGKEPSWADVKLSLAETNVFGNLNETGETWILSAFAFLNKKAKEAKEYEKS